MSKIWTVKVIEYSSGEVVKAIDAQNERAADRIDLGLNINLNHEKFYTLIEQPKEHHEHRE